MIKTFKMKNYLFLLLIVTICLTRCDEPDNCGTIINKITEPNRYLFVIDFEKNTTSNNDQDKDGGLIGDLEVDEKTFSNYEKGDDYCAD